MDRSFGSRRGRVELFGDILQAIDEDTRIYGSPRLTRVQGNTNLPYDRFKFFVDKLVEMRLLALQRRGNYFEIRLEEKGLEFVRNYKAVKKLLDTFSQD